MRTLDDKLNLFVFIPTHKSDVRQQTPGLTQSCESAVCVCVHVYERLCVCVCVSLTAVELQPVQWAMTLIYNQPSREQVISSYHSNRMSCDE